MHVRNIFIIATSSRNTIRALVFPLIHDIVNSEIFARVLILRMRSFVKINPREMAESLCRLLMAVNHVLVANFQRRKYVF